MTDSYSVSVDFDQDREVFVLEQDGDEITIDSDSADEVIQALSVGLSALDEVKNDE